MNSMKCILGAWVLVGLVVGCAQAQTAPASAPASAPAASSGDVDPILDALDARGKDLSDFTANVTKTDKDVGNGTETKLSGKMWMQRLAGDDARLRVSFDRKTANDKPEKTHQEYVLAGGTLTDRSYDSRKENRWQVLKPGQKLNLLKLGEGPFPLPLGQDKADVHKMFEVAKLPSAKDDPPGTEHVQLKPKPGTHFADKFSTIDFCVDMKSRMPVRIVTLDPNQTTTTTTELKDVQINTKLTDDDFKLEPIDQKAWEITEKPYED